MTQIESAATGADFVTNGKQLLLVGDNPTGRERVQVTPEGSPNINGPQQPAAQAPQVYIYVNDSTTGERIVADLRNNRIPGLVPEITRQQAAMA